MDFLAHARTWSLCSSSKDHVAFLSIHGLYVLEVKLVFSVYQEQCGQTLKIQLICVFAVTLNSQKDDISLYTTMQWDIRNNSPQKEVIQRESFAVERYFHIRKSIKNIEEPSTNEQGHKIEIKMTPHEAKKGETKWKWNKVSTGWNITYSHHMFSSCKDYACALTYWVDARYCSMKGKAVET